MRPRSCQAPWDIDPSVGLFPCSNHADEFLKDLGIWVCRECEELIRESQDHVFVTKDWREHGIRKIELGPRWAVHSLFVESGCPHRSSLVLPGKIYPDHKDFCLGLLPGEWAWTIEEAQASVLKWAKKRKKNLLAQVRGVNKEISEIERIISESGAANV
jgi:hypothetical protein